MMLLFSERLTTSGFRLCFMTKPKFVSALNFLAYNLLTLSFLTRHSSTHIN